MHDMAVRQHQAIRSKHKSGSPALALAGLSRTASARLRHVNLDHRRADCLRSTDDSLRIGIEQSRVVENTYFCGLDNWPGVIRDW
jgi:hypothetical protein